MKRAQIIKIIKEEIESVLAEQTSAAQKAFAKELCKNAELRARLQRDQDKETNKEAKATRAMLIMQSKMRCPDAWK